MICTDNDNYVNISYKKESKNPALLKLPNFFLKSTMLNAQKHLQRSHSFIVNVLI